MVKISQSASVFLSLGLCVPFYEGGERKESCLASPAIVYYAVLSQGYLPNETDLNAGGTRQTALHAAAAGATRAVFGRNVFVRAVVEISNNVMAALRLMRPDWVIPATSALNLVEGDGYRRGLRAGANLVTINMTPDGMRDEYIIYKRDRFIMTEARVLAAIEAEGLTPSRQGLADYYRNAMASPATRERASMTG
jgi:hypothetical protein